MTGFMTAAISADCVEGCTSETGEGMFVSGFEEASCAGEGSEWRREEKSIADEDGFIWMESCQ